jgi:membrane-associated phospholipid phosphatase
MFIFFAVILSSLFFPVQVEAKSWKNAVETAGDALQIMLPAYAFGMAMNEGDREYRGAKELVYSFVSTQLTVEILKRLVEEKRPNYRVGDRLDSFPSGHTAIAFLGAAFVHRRYSLGQALIPYSLALLTGYSRILARQHHFQDVIFGALLSSFYVWLFAEKRETLSISLGNNSVSLTYKININ